MDDEAFLDDEIYDDDSPDHHPVDDDDLGVLGGLARPPDPSVDAPDLQPASCFTPEYLAALAGTDNLEACTFLEMRADTTDEDLSGVGRLMPALSQLRLSNSVLPEMRAFGSAFQRLTVLWIARSEVEDLAGVASLVDLRELYAAFNEVSDVTPLAELDHLRVIDLEGNRVEDPDAPDYLGMCPRLSSLSLEGNPLSRRTYYRRIVCRAIPRLRVLDDRDVDDAIDRMEIPDGLEDEEGPEPNADDATGAMYADDPDPVASAAAAFRSLDTSAELAMVTEGIKYAAVGIDDPDAVLTRDEVTGELSVELSDAPLGGDFFSGGEQRYGDGFPDRSPGAATHPRARARADRVRADRVRADRVRADRVRVPGAAVRREARDRRRRRWFARVAPARRFAGRSETRGVRDQERRRRRSLGRERRHRVEAVRGRVPGRPRVGARARRRGRARRPVRVRGNGRGRRGRRGLGRGRRPRRGGRRRGSAAGRTPRRSSGAKINRRRHARGWRIEVMSPRGAGEPTKARARSPRGRGCSWGIRRSSCPGAEEETTKRGEVGVG